jgi:putrescine transport system ATP-binding protein
VSDFIGEVNLFKGSLVAGADGGLTILTAEGDTLSVDIDEHLAGGAAVEIAVRPEKIHLNAEPRQGENVFSGVVVDHAFLGAMTKYRVGLDSGKAVMVLRQNHGAPEERPLQHGDRVTVSWDRAWAKVFACLGEEPLDQLSSHT